MGWHFVHHKVFSKRSFLVLTLKFTRVPSQTPLKSQQNRNKAPFGFATLPSLLPSIQRFEWDQWKLKQRLNLLFRQLLNKFLRSAQRRQIGRLGHTCPVEFGARALWRRVIFTLGTRVWLCVKIKRRANLRTAWWFAKQRHRASSYSWRCLLIYDEGYIGIGQDKVREKED